jgi:FkbM family methyltransferase
MDQDEIFETVVAENRKLRTEVKALRERVTALESSRWWRLHPRHILTRPRPRHHEETRNGTQDVAERAKVTRLGRQWRLKAEYERRNSGAAQDEIVVRDGIRLKLHPESRYAIEQFCFRSPEMVEELDAFIANTSDRQRLLDAGAYHGLFSLVFAAKDPAKEALAVDASPIAFPKLLYGIHKNHAMNIEAVECALSSDGGTLEMHFDSDPLVAGAGGFGQPSLRIDSQTGDRLCEAHSFAPDVIKIDVEGHEVRVVQGLQETIARSRPLIFLELHPATIEANEGNGTVGDLVSKLIELEYSRAELRGQVVPTEALTDFVEIERMLLRPDNT